MTDQTFTPEPKDTYNQALADAVHPTDWVNPEPAGRYNLVVVGAGTAGLVSAAGAAGLGARVALIERHLMGGDCLNVGCVPSKGVISAARAWSATEHADDFGGPKAAGSGDFEAAMQRMRRLRSQLAAGDSVQRFSDLGVDVFLGDGRFTGHQSVEVDGKTLTFRRAVIATGARATGLPIEGLEETGYLTNETVFSLTSAPKHFAIIGGGPIGCEMAQAFARLGSQVTILDAGKHILPREDVDAAQLVAATMARDGVNYIHGVKILSAQRVGNAESQTRRINFDRDGNAEHIDCDQILLAVGRRPNVDGLGLEAAGVDYDERVGVKVNSNLRTTNKRIFACGDVASAFKFTHAADAQARIVIKNALFFGRAKVESLVIPWCTYTSPEIAHVGLYPAQAKEQGIEIDTIKIPLSEVDRAVLDGEDEGFLSVHVKRGKDRIVGATLVAAHAGDMIGELVLAITAGVGLNTISATIHPYPTQGEVIKKAADAWRRTKLTPRVAKLFKTWFRIFA